MKIKYTSCDGITEVEEEITKAEFGLWKAPNGKDVLIVDCTRLDGELFECDVDRVDYIKQ